MQSIWESTKDSYLDTYRTLVWIWFVILSEQSRHYATRALVLLLVSQFLAMGITYIMKDIVNALGAGDQDTAVTLLMVGVGGLLLFQHVAASAHDYNRELSWNYNYSGIVTGMSNMLFSRTVQEVITEDSEIGPEQIESAKDKVQNILYSVLFEGSTVITTLISANVLMYVVDSVVGCLMTILIGINLLWFLFWNTCINEKMDLIDKSFRKAHRRMVEKWHFILSTKTNGVEDKMTNQTYREIQRPLYADKLVWAHWFLKINFLRWIINIVYVVLMLYYGIAISNWSGGDFAAMFAWTFIILEKFDFIGHLMRHLTTQVARIKALQQALMQEPAFDYNEGIEYERSI